MGIGASGHISEAGPWAAFTSSLEHVDPHVIFWVLLPALLYEDAFHSTLHILKTIWVNVAIMAGAGVVMTAVILGGFVYGAFQPLPSEDRSWRFVEALLLGSILSCTDPVAVIGALNKVSILQIFNFFRLLRI